MPIDWMWSLRRNLIGIVTTPQRPKNESYESALVALSTHSVE
jgi:hypothetical protein